MANQSQYTATVLPINATNPDVEWSVIPDTGNASIDENGLLTALAPGIVEVAATAKDGSGVSVSKEVTIVEAL